MNEFTVIREERAKRKAEVCTCPAWLCPAAQKVWHELAPALFDEGLLVPLHTTALALLCSVAAEVATLEEIVEAKGRFYQTPAGLKRIHPAAAMLPAARNLFAKCLGDFCLTPNSFKQLRLGERKAL